MSLSAGEVSFDSTSGRIYRDSDSHTPNPSSVPRSMCHNPIDVPSLAYSGHKRKCCVSKQDNFSDDDAPTSAPLLRMRCKSYFYCKVYNPFLIYLSQLP